MKDGAWSRRLGRWTPLLLILSVAINVFMVGAFFGHWTMPHRPPGPPDPAAMMSHMVEDLGRDMNPADRAILERAFQNHFGAMRDRGADHRADFDAIRQALGADPFDQAAVRRAMETAAQHEAAERQTIEEILIEAASQMSADGRHRMAGWQPGPPPDRR